MPPRTYVMSARASAAAETRAAILAAAVRLHADRGILATSWPAIAEAAGVSPATVYRHFPGAPDLIPACGRTVFDLVRPPTPDEAAVEFAALDDAGDRFAQLARESAHCYRRGEGWLDTAYRERDFDRDVDAVVTLFQDSVHVLVEAAAGRRLTRAQHAVLFVLCDFPFWKSLVDAGLGHAGAERVLVDLVRAETGRLGLSTKESS